MENTESAIHFLLVPDSSAGRRLRRLLAEDSARSDVVVGVWRELLTLASDNALIPCPPDASWREALQHALSNATNAFWLESYEASPAETTAVIGDVYSSLLAETEPQSGLKPLAALELPNRAKRHLLNLCQLHDELCGSLPPELALIRALLRTQQGQCVRELDEGGRALSHERLLRQRQELPHHEPGRAVQQQA